MNMEALTPSMALLAKIGSVIVHFDEYHSTDGHAHDFESAMQLLNDIEVKVWLARMKELALIPELRNKKEVESNETTP